MMSHELRTPLNILLGYTRMLLEAVDDGDVMTGAERRDDLRRMLAGGLRLGDLVEDTLSGAAARRRARCGSSGAARARRVLRELQCSIGCSAGRAT
jgi:signal transduction histidine kinase